MQSGRCYTEIKYCSFAHCLLQAYNLNKQTYKPLCGFSVFVSVAVKYFTRKYFTRSDGMTTYEAIILRYYECVSVFLPWLFRMKIASFVRRILLLSVACLALTYF
jgi:hypothetical protein